MDSFALNVLTALGVLLALGGIFQIVFRHQEVRARQRSYDATRWWSYPPIWQEHAITVVGGLLMLAIGIFLIVASRVAARLPDGY
jgi:predicted phage tail protein